MLSRRIIYIALLIGAAVFHFAYGQYVTHFVLLFLLFAPLLSLLLSLPAALKTNAVLYSGKDVYRGAEGSVTLKAECGFFVPPEALRFTLIEENLFSGDKSAPIKVTIKGAGELDRSFSPNTSKLGVICYTIKKARAYDYLGLIAIPVRRGGPVAFTVLPVPERPDPEPQLTEQNNYSRKPKRQGFAEEHEVRPYREGDPINLIHWKLTAKHDEVIVREPQELIRKKVVLSADLPETYAEHQSVIEQICHLNGVLAENEMPYYLQFGHDAHYIDCENDFIDFIKGVLIHPMRTEKALPVIAGNDTIVYRIVPRVPGKEGEK